MEELKEIIIRALYSKKYPVKDGTTCEEYNKRDEYAFDLYDEDAIFRYEVELLFLVVSDYNNEELAKKDEEIAKLNTELAIAYEDIDKLDHELHDHSRRHSEMYDHIARVREAEISKLKEENERLKKLLQCIKRQNFRRV